MKTLYKIGGLLAVAALAWTVSKVAEAQNQPLPIVAPASQLNTPRDLSQQTIEQLIDYITGLKKQRTELEKLEASALTVLKQRLKEANERAAQLEGKKVNPTETKTETKESKR